jgi:hypothetical protein
MSNEALSSGMSQDVKRNWSVGFLLLILGCSAMSAAYLSDPEAVDAAKIAAAERKGLEETPAPESAAENDGGFWDWLGGGDETVIAPTFEDYSSEGNSTLQFQNSLESNDETEAVDGMLQCVAINTGRWGHSETVDPSKPIVDTPLQAIELLPNAQTGRIYVRQGDEIKLFDSHDVFANGSCFFVGE